MDKKMSFHLSYVFIALIGVLLLHDLWVTYRSVETIPYSQFQAFVREGKVAEVLVSENAIEGVLKTPDHGRKRFITTRVSPEIAGELDRHGVTYAGQVRDTFLRTLLSWIVPALVFIGLWMVITRKLSASGAGGALKPGRRRPASSSSTSWTRSGRRAAWVPSRTRSANRR